VGYVYGLRRRKSMGRKKKYYTEEQKKEANNEKAKKYYLANREEVRRRNREAYHTRKVGGINGSKGGGISDGEKEWDGRKFNTEQGGGI